MLLHVFSALSNILGLVIIMTLTHHLLNVPRLPGEHCGGAKHEEAVVEHQSVLAEILGLQLLFHQDSVTSGEEIIEQHVNIAEMQTMSIKCVFVTCKPTLPSQIEREIIAGCHNRSENHKVNRHLY